MHAFRGAISQRFSQLATACHAPVSASSSFHWRSGWRRYLLATNFQRRLESEALHHGHDSYLG